MKRQRHFFISDDLDDLDALEDELERAGIGAGHIHVLTLDDAGAETRAHLRDVQSIMKKDVIQAGEYGLAVGVAAALLVIAITWMAEWYTSPAGWIPFVFLAIILLGFFTWEGGFIGIQTFNSNFKRFEQELQSGRHVFFVDLNENQEHILRDVIQAHPTARMAGTGRSTPHWIVSWQQRLKSLFAETLP